MSLRFLSRTDVLAAGGADMAAAVADARAAFGLLHTGRAVMPAETSVPLAPPATGNARAYALPARLDGSHSVAGVKWTAHRPPISDGAPSILGLTLVNDAASGRPLGMVESALLTIMRTAATTALALEVLSPVAPHRVALLGAGAQARGHLRMLAALHPALQTVTLWNRTARHAAELRAAFPDAPWPIELAATPERAMDGADAVLSCTDAQTPFLPPCVVGPDRLVAQIGRNEVPFAAIDRADAVVVDLWGAFAATSAKSLFAMHRAGRFPETSVAADLGTALAGEWRPGRNRAVYFSSFGLNVLDVALAARVLRHAHERGIGTVLSLDGACGAWPWR